MTTALYTHPAFDGHAEPPGHPEQAARLDAVAEGLAGLTLDRRGAPVGIRDDVLRCHPERYVARIEAAVPARGWVQVDGDTYMAPGSLAAAMHAVGGVCAAVDAVLAGEAGDAVAAPRPPGHHAERGTAVGVCPFGHVPNGAMRALDHHGLGRVAVLDFDVHHGNGTQDLLWDEGRAFFASSHQMPLYPGSGHPGERGAHGQIVNVPLPPGSGRAAMRAAWDGHVLSHLRDFAPALILVSAGFDAHADDPLANLMWDEDDFAWITGRICDLADELCAGRVVSVLEGGYDLAALGRSVRAHVGVLEERGR